MLCAGKVTVGPEAKAYTGELADMIKEGTSEAFTAIVRSDDEFSARTLHFIGEIEVGIASDR
jgi:hypothetical protein